MSRYTVKACTKVWIYSEMQIEADSEDEARLIAKGLIDDDKVEWENVNGEHVPLSTLGHWDPQITEVFIPEEEEE